MTAWVRFADLPSTVAHASPHLDARGFCRCSGICCIDSTDGKCKCPGCACAELAHCRGDLCSHTWPTTVKR